MKNLITRILSPKEISEARKEIRKETIKEVAYDLICLVLLLAAGALMVLIGVILQDI